MKRAAPGEAPTRPGRASGDRGLLILRRLVEAGRTSTTMLASPFLRVGITPKITVFVYRIQLGRTQLLPVQDICASHSLATPGANVNGSAISMTVSQRRNPEMKFRGICMSGIKVSIVACAEAAARVQVQVIFYFTMLHLLSFFGLAALFHALKPDMEWLMGRLTGATCCPFYLLTPTRKDSQRTAYPKEGTFEHVNARVSPQDAKHVKVTGYAQSVHAS